MKKDKKQRLFEVMSRLDKTFKPKLNENWYGDSNSYAEYIDEIKHFVSLIDNGKFDEAKQLLNKFENEGKINGLKSYLKEYGEFEAENWVFDNLGNMSENIYKDDDKTSKAFRDFAKASDPEGHKRRWDKERPNEKEPEQEKPQAMNVMKKDLNEKSHKEPFKNLKYEKSTQTIRTVPENYWIASVKDDGEIVFDSWDGAIKDRVDKNYVINWFNKNVKNVNEEDLNERKPVGINPKYTHFALLKDSKKFVNGWDFKGVDPEDLKQDKMHYFFQDIIDMDIDPKNVLVGTVKKFQKEGLDPFDSNNWYKHKLGSDNSEDNDDLTESASSGDEYFPITTPVGSEDDKLFIIVVNKGIDSHLEAFTKSKFEVKDTSIGKRRVFNFHTSELPIVLRRLEEIGTEEALMWKDDIENYDANINEISLGLANTARDKAINYADNSTDNVNKRININRAQKFSNYINPELVNYGRRFDIKVIRDDYAYTTISYHDKGGNHGKIEIDEKGEITNQNIDLLPDRLLRPFKTLIAAVQKDLKVNNTLEEDINQVKYRAEVTGIGENRWSGNAMEYDTEEEAKQWLDNLSQRWFGYDMGRVVPTTTPKGQPVDMENDVIYQNFRR